MNYRANERRAKLVLTMPSAADGALMNNNMNYRANRTE